jgi:hypothetical protein
VSTLTLTAVRTIAFGDLEAGVWGAGWVGSEALLVVGTETDARALPDSSIQGAEADEEWAATADGAELTIAPAGEPATEAVLGGFDQLCYVRGTVTLAGVEQPVECLGRRALRGQLELDRLESVRDFSAWFKPIESGESAESAAEGLALTALRPRDSVANDTDLITAALLEPGASTAVADPRLSTTYSADGAPIRVGLELWLEVDPEGEQPFPRRAAGEALAAIASAATNGFDLQARPFRCHTRGREGLGVYLLARAR